MGVRLILPEAAFIGTGRASTADAIIPAALEIPGFALAFKGGGCRAFAPLHAATFALEAVRRERRE